MTSRHSLGITTYRENASENADLPAYKLFKNNHKRKAAESIAKTVRKRLLKHFKDIRIVSCNPSIDIYERGRSRYNFF